MAFVTVQGEQVTIPDDIARLSKPGIADYLVSQRGFATEQVGLGVTAAPETGGLSAALPGAAGSSSAAQAIALGRFLAERGIGQDMGTAGQEQLRAAQPIASLAGEAIPFAAAGPSMVGAVTIGGGLEALRAGSTPGSVALQSGLAAGGQVLGGLAGRVVGKAASGVAGLIKGVAESIRGRTPSTVLATGIKTTIGKVTGNRGLQQTEASLARQPLTSGPFRAIDQQNESLVRGKALRYLGVADDIPLEEGVKRAVVDATEKMDQAIPADASILIPGRLAQQFRRLQSIAERGAFDLPESAIKGGRVSGDDLRVVISDLKAGARSSRAGTRRNARQALAELDAVMQADPNIDQALWADGSRQYGRWLKLTDGKAISTVDTSKINPATLLNNLSKGNKAAVRSGVSTGDSQLDDFIATLKDFRSVGSLTPDSGTPTGLAIPLIIADVAATGGVGTAAGILGSRVSQTPAGLRAFEGAVAAQPAAARVAGGVGAAIASQFGDLTLADLLRDDSAVPAEAIPSGAVEEDFPEQP